MTEQDLLNIINKKFKTSFKLISDEYSSYDAEEDRYILEIKNRRAYYPTKIIEIYKMVANYQKSQLLDKVFLYAVSDEKGIYIFLRLVDDSYTVVIRQTENYGKVGAIVSFEKPSVSLGLASSFQYMDK